ncbi:MAG TPA: DUF6506 family protein [Clostridia bacterium]|nr:DUF6506 family protein [Clostridia bacterium]
MLQAAFLFLSPDADSAKNRTVVATSAVELTVVGVKDYTDAVNVAKALVSNGCKCIELCGGFGFIGTAKIVEAVDDEASVGAVRFDCHPGLNGESGDKLF